LRVQLANPLPNEETEIKSSNDTKINDIKNSDSKNKNTKKSEIKNLDVKNKDVKNTPIKNNKSDTIKLNLIFPKIDEDVLRKHFSKAGLIRRIFKPDNKDFA